MHLNLLLLLGLLLLGLLHQACPGCCGLQAWQCRQPLLQGQLQATLATVCAQRQHCSSNACTCTTYSCIALLTNSCWLRNIGCSLSR
jgi:hypothetical protein